jgi:polyferredoxin
MNLMKRKTLILLLVFLLAGILVGCIPGDGKNTSDNPAGFLWGIWHGWVAPISLIISIFNKSIRIYETANTGWWYDFGFYISIISGFGGLSLVRKSKKKD